MVNCIADQVEQRFTDLVDNRFVQFRLLPDENQVYLFAVAMAEIFGTMRLKR